jgi:hypothetical protein
MTRILTRGLIAVLAGLVLVWLAFSIHLVDLEETGDSAVKLAQAGKASQAQIQAGFDALQDARRHNPDQTPLLQEGYLWAADHKPQKAFASGLMVVKKEPDNVQGWALVWLGAPDKAVGENAARGVRRLNPWLGDSLGQRWR